MDYIALSGVNCFLRRRKNFFRLFLTALLSSILGLFSVLFVQDEMLRTICIHFGINTAMVFLGFGRCSKREFMEDWSVMYLGVLFLGGIMEWLIQKEIFKGSFLLQAGVAAAIVTGVTIYLERREQFACHIFPVVLYDAGRTMELKAYWDSGNQLLDSYSGRPVSIISRKRAMEFLDIREKGIRYVPYSSLGRENGLLPVCSVESMQIYNGKKTIEIRPAILGIADAGLLEKKEYDLILHASMLEKRLVQKTEK